MKLQLALDTLTSAQGIALVETLADSIDIIEVGTPLIMREGLSAVRAFRSAFPRHLILADTKIMDAGCYEASLAYEAGADLVTVLAAAGDNTVRGCLEAAASFQKELMADMICVGDIAARAACLDAMGVHHLCVHTAVDDQTGANGPWTRLETLLPALKRSGAAVAGGIGPANIDEVLAFRPGILVAGGAITGAADPAAVARSMKTAIMSL